MGTKPNQPSRKTLRPEGEKEVTKMTVAAKERAASHRAPPSALRRISSILLFLYVSVRRHLSAAWIRLNRWLGQPDRILIRDVAESGAAHPPFHKVLVIGDGLAIGLGDGGVVFGSDAGVSPHLQAALGLEPTIRRKWKVVNRGEVDATTDLWLPPSGDTGGRPAGRLYDSVFGPRGAGCDAEVVVLMMGTSDAAAGVDSLPIAALYRDMIDIPYPESELSETAKNVRTIARALRDEGRRVCVVDLPATGVPGAGRGRMRRLNQQLRQVVNCINEDGGTVNSSGALAPSPEELGRKIKISLHPVQYLSLGKNHRLMRPEFRAFDSLHLNRSGYKILALDIFENGGVKGMMVNVEWDVWRGHLGCSTEKKTW